MSGSNSSRPPSRQLILINPPCAGRRRRNSFDRVMRTRARNPTMPGHGHFSITISWALLGLLLSASLLNAEPADFPKEARERFDRGRDLQKKGQLREAVIAYDEAIQLGMKDYPRVHLYRAEAVRELKDY